MEIKTLKRIKEYLYELPYNYVPIINIDAFNLLYKLENSLRLFVYAVLKSEYGGDWANTKIRQDKEITISSSFKHRKKELESYGHIGVLPNIPLLYLTLDELVSIMLNESLRRMFKPHFPASLERVYKTKFWEVIILRNNLVHFRKLTEQDFKRLLNNLEDLTPPIENYLADLFASESEEYIPTQKDEWYSSWMSLSLKKKKFTTIRLKKSKSKPWIKLFLFVNTFVKKSEEGYCYYYNIGFDKVINLVKDILPHIIYFRKGIFLPGIVPPNYDNVSDNRISLCIHQRQFKKNYDNIFSLFVELVDNIEGEFQSILDKNKDIRKKISLKLLESRFKDYEPEDEDNVPRFDLVEDFTGIIYSVPFRALEFESPWAK